MTKKIYYYLVRGAANMCAVKNKENIDYFGAVVYITIAINLNFTLLLYFLTLLSTKN